VRRPGDSNGLLRVAHGVTAHPLDSELVLYDPSGEKAYVLNATGKEFWELCSAGQSVESATQSIAEKYGRGREEVSSDIEELLRGLRAAGLVLPEGDIPFVSPHRPKGDEEILDEPSARADHEGEEDEVVEAARRFLELTEK
jgi:hypothetical protein